LVKVPKHTNHITEYMELNTGVHAQLARAQRRCRKRNTFDCLASYQIPTFRDAEKMKSMRRTAPIRVTVIVVNISNG